MISPNDKLDPAEGAASDKAQTLRAQAEGTVRTREESRPEALGSEDTKRLVHELCVHQIELKMQNEELRHAQDALEASRARFADLFDSAPIGYVTTNEAGLILEANLTAATLLGVIRSKLVSQPLTRFIMSEDQDIYYLHCKALLEKDVPQACELRLLRKDNSPFWARLEAAAAQDTDGTYVLRVVISDVTAQNLLKRQLLQSLDALETLAAELSLSEERERRRIALTLHDHVVQNLAIGKLKLDVALQKGQVAHGPVLHELQEILDTSMLDLRDLSFDLSPPILYDLGLDAAFVSLGEKFSKKYGFRFIFYPGYANEDLCEDLKISVYQFFRELLTNAVKYADAETVTVLLRQEANRLMLSVDDDGKGFNSFNCREGFGLANIRQRVNYLRGELRIKSAPGVGTRVVICIDTRLAVNKRASDATERLAVKIYR